jgi:hypothetical protein
MGFPRRLLLGNALVTGDDTSCNGCQSCTTSSWTLSVTRAPPEPSGAISNTSLSPSASPEYAIRAPSGDQAACVSAPAPLVSRVAAPPVREVT